jgi:hypothetical protein
MPVARCLGCSRCSREIDRVFKARKMGHRYHGTVAEVPALHLVKVSASMHGVEIRTRNLEAIDPFVRDNAGVGVTHKNMSQNLEAVI